MSWRQAWLPSTCSMCSCSVTPLDNHPINRFHTPANSTMVVLYAFYEYDGPLSQLTIVASSRLLATLERFTKSHIVSASVQGQHGSHCISTDTYVSGYIKNSYASCFQPNDFPLFLYTEWVWHDRPMKFTNAQIQQGIEILSCYNKTT